MIHYVPSERSLKDLYDELLIPFLRRQTAEAIEPHADAIAQVLNETADHLNNSLKTAGLADITARFTFPGESLERLIHSFDFILKDPQETSIFRKGMGIQATTLLASFLWVTEQEVSRGKNVIWLIEEPESFLHPQLNKACLSILRELAQKVLVITTTHSLGFVPQDPRIIAGTEIKDKCTRVVSFETYAEATRSIRTSLGVGFSDFYNLGRFNVLVEGKTDRQYFQAVLDALPASGDCEWPALRSTEVSFLDYGGVKHLSGFLRATWEFIRMEKPCVSVSDGDDAGLKEIRALQGYFGNKEIPFQANQHYVLVRNGFAIEGLFPDDWIIELHESHPSWFETDYSVDASGQLASFKIKKDHKASVVRALCSKIEESDSGDWSERWKTVCTAVNAALLSADKTIEKR